MKEESRPRGITPEDQQKKYRAHKKANEVIAQYLKRKNYIAAYLVSFSLFEDRIRAFYAVKLKNEKIVSQDKWLHDRFDKMVKKLSDHLSIKDQEEITRLAKARNKLVHSAMYNVDVFTAQHIIEVRTVTEKIVDAFNKYKRSMRAASKKLETENAANRHKKGK